MLSSSLSRMRTCTALSPGVCAWNVHEDVTGLWVLEYYEDGLLDFPFLCHAQYVPEPL